MSDPLEITKIALNNLLYNLKQRNHNRKESSWSILKREWGMGRTIDVNYTCWPNNQKWGLSWRRKNLSAQDFLQDTNEGQSFNILFMTYNKMNEQENSNF